MKRKLSPKGILLTIVAAVVVVTGGGLVVLNRSDNNNTKAKSDNSAQQQAASNDQKAAVQNVSYQGEDGKTALELLKTHAQIVTKDSSYGPYVDSINGVAGGTDGKYWSFYVNGQQAEVGADAYVTQSTDMIEWKFE